MAQPKPRTMSGRVFESLCELADEGALHLHSQRHVGSFEDCMDAPCRRNRVLLQEGRLLPDRTKKPPKA
jgi:hypothetical protein